MGFLSDELNVVLGALQVPICLLLLVASGGLVYVKNSCTSIMTRIKTLGKWAAKEAEYQRLKVLIHQSRCAVSVYAVAVSVAILIIPSLRDVMKHRWIETGVNSLEKALIRLSWQMVGLIIMLVFKRTCSAETLNLSYVILMLGVCCFVMPMFCPPNLVPEQVGLTWLLRFSLLPLCDSFVLVALCNTGCHLACRYALEMRFDNLRTTDELGGGKIWSRLEDLVGPVIFPRFEEGLRDWMYSYTEITITWDIMVAVSCCIVCLCIRQALALSTSHVLEAVDLKFEKSATSSLLATICDAHFILDSEYCLERDEKGLAALLFHTDKNKGVSFLNAFASDEDRQRFQEAVSQSNEKSSMASVTNLKLRDGVGTVVPVEVFHVKMTGFPGEEAVRHLVGIRENGDDKFTDGRALELWPQSPLPPLPLRSEALDCRLDVCSKSSGSSSQEDRDLSVLFNVVSLEVIFASARLLKKVPDVHDDSIFLDFVSVQDCPSVEMELANALLDMQSSNQTTCRIELSFRLRHSKGLRRWRVDLQSQQGDVIGCAHLFRKLGHGSQKSVGKPEPMKLPALQL